MSEKFDFHKIFDDAQKRIEDCKNAPDWVNQDNTLAKIEAIRLKAYQEIMALGFDFPEIQVDVSIMPVDDDSIYRLAASLGWITRHSWYEPICKTDGGEITIYYEAETDIGL